MAQHKIDEGAFGVGGVVHLAVVDLRKRGVEDRRQVAQECLGRLGRADEDLVIVLIIVSYGRESAVISSRS